MAGITVTFISRVLIQTFHSYNSVQCTDSFGKTLLITLLTLFLHASFLDLLACMRAMFSLFTSARHRLTLETIEYLATFLRIPHNKAMYSSCWPYILYQGRRKWYGLNGNGRTGFWLNLF